MVFVPMHQAEVSPRAQELARRINEVISAYKSAHPDLSGIELQQALMRAAMNAGPGGSGGTPQRAVILSAALGLVVALGMMLFLLGREGGSGRPWPAIAVLIAVIAIATTVFIIRRSSS